VLMGASICCAEAEADTQFTIFDLSALKKQCLISYLLSLYGTVMAIHDYINLAREGNDVFVKLSLEYVPAVEHFANYKNAQIFMMVDFAITSLGKTSHIERCLGCYAQEREKEEKPNMVDIANERLRLLYEEFDQASVEYEQVFFK